MLSKSLASRSRGVPWLAVPLKVRPEVVELGAPGLDWWLSAEMVEWQPPPLNLKKVGCERQGP